MFEQVVFWWSVISTLFGIVFFGVSIWQIAAARSEASRKKDQVKIWMQDANGVQLALRRVIIDNLEKRYTSTNDMANALWAIHANAFALYQSLYEERCVTEEEYKQQQKELMEQVKMLDQTNNTSNNNNKLPSPEKDKKAN